MEICSVTPSDTYNSTNSAPFQCVCGSISIVASVVFILRPVYSLARVTWMISPSGSLTKSATSTTILSPSSTSCCWGITECCTTLSFTGKTVTLTVTLAMSSPAASTNCIIMVPSHSGIFTWVIDNSDNELLISNMLWLSSINCASTIITSSPSGSSTNKSGVTTTDECWSSTTSGNGSVICSGTPILVTITSSQSEKE